VSWVEPRGSCLLIVGARTARLFAADSVTPLATAELEATSLDVAALGALLAQASRTTRTRLQVVISDAWLAAAELPWSEALLVGLEAHEHARVQLELAGQGAAGLDIAIDDAPPGSLRIACALPRAVLEALTAAAAASHFELDCVVPLSSCVGVARREALPADRALVGLVDAGAVSLATLVDGRVQAVVSRVHDGNPSAVLEGLWRRQRLRDAASASLESLHLVNMDGVETATGAHVVPLAALTPADIATAARRVGALDFVRRPRAPRAWQWATAAALLVATVGLGWQSREVQAELSTNQAALQALQAAPVRPKRPEGAARRAQEEELRIARMQWSALELPLDELFAAVRPPVEARAALLSVELAAPRMRANGSTVRLSGEARDSEAMTLYLAHLGSTRPFVGAELTHHEALGARGGGAHRFTMEATWAR